MSQDWLDDPSTSKSLTIHMAPPEFSWCDQCMKSTAYAVRLYRLTADGVAAMGEVSGCTERERHA